MCLMMVLLGNLHERRDHFLFFLPHKSWWTIKEIVHQQKDEQSPKTISRDVVEVMCKRKIVQEEKDRSKGRKTTFFDGIFRLRHLEGHVLIKALDRAGA